MARISLDPPRSLASRLAAAYSRRRYGRVLDPIAAVGHHPRALWDGGRYEQRVARWNALDAQLKQLAVMACSVRIGCSWCLDFGHWEAHRLGMSEAKVRAVPRWREHRELFGDLELRVMEFAEAMTDTEPTVTDGMTAPLVERLGERAFVELVMMVAVENQRSRVNAALGLVGQGFSEQCEVAPRPR